MRPVSILVSLLGVVLLAVVVSGTALHGTAAQDATPTAGASLAGHPLVGTWIVDTDAATPDDATSVITVGADGTYQEVDPDGTVGLGTWGPTGERTAVLTILFPDESSTLLTRATVEVATGGQGFTAAYTFEVVGPDGTPTGEYGPGQAIGLRVEAEAPGTPVGTLEELFALLQEATPAP